MTHIGIAWRRVRDRFRQAGLDTPELDARILAEKAFGLDRLALVTREREVATAESLGALDAMAERRLRGEPVARILGEKEFYGLTFLLGSETLVPRPETELLVGRALELLDERGGGRILDLGTGTGCIPISILAASPRSSAVAVDISAEALACAQANADRHEVADRIQLRRGSWYDALEAGERFDLILSNPPYIRSADVPGLMREVRDHDPFLALDGGADGLEAYRTILGGAAARLSPAGAVLVEIGSDQAFDVKSLFFGGRLRDVIIHKDLAGLDRVVEGHHL